MLEFDKNRPKNKEILKLGLKFLVNKRVNVNLSVLQDYELCNRRIKFDS